jgi:hypothetical protein
MTPANYCTKAIEQFEAGGNPAMPISSAALAYIAGKLRLAEKFLMPEGGRLLPADKEKPEVPGLVFRPPYPVIALEYAMKPGTDDEPTTVYTSSHAPKRIALAWDWQNDFPAALRSREIDQLPPGVCVLEMSWRTEINAWMPGLACLHIPYDGEWQQTDERPAFVQAMIDRGKVSARFARPGRTAYPHTIVPMLTEAIVEKAIRERSYERAIDLIRSDTQDELISYIDLCYALACKNVSLQRQQAPEKLNRARVKSGKPPLADYHVLVLDGDGDGAALGASSRSAARPHLRRGHIRRLNAERITWVNSAMVRGRGAFVSKDYALRAVAQ